MIRIFGVTKETLEQALTALRLEVDAAIDLKTERVVAMTGAVHQDRGQYAMNDRVTYTLTIATEPRR